MTLKKLDARRSKKLSINEKAPFKRSSFEGSKESDLPPWKLGWPYKEVLLISHYSEYSTSSEFLFSRLPLALINSIMFLASLRERPSSLTRAIMVMFCLISVVLAATEIRRGADPSVILLNKKYYQVETGSGGIWVRESSTLAGLGNKESMTRTRVWDNPEKRPEVWAPELATDNGKIWIMFTAGKSNDHRMYGIWADKPMGPYSKETKIKLPDDDWAIDGNMFTFGGKRWFVWAGRGNGIQSLYICQMKTPTQSIGERYVISQPREEWEKKDGINEAPEAIVDPNGQLHIAYSANPSWNDKYCIADLRLRKGGNPIKIWDWYKSNGCLFGSHQGNMMKGWDTTLHINGPGHHSFGLPNGRVVDSPSDSNRHGFLFHGVPKGTKYGWSERRVYTGQYVWWPHTTYHRGGSTPKPHDDKGYSIKYFE